MSKPIVIWQQQRSHDVIFLSYIHSIVNEHMHSRSAFLNARLTVLAQEGCIWVISPALLEAELYNTTCRQDVLIACSNPTSCLVLQSTQEKRLAAGTPLLFPNLLCAETSLCRKEQAAFRIALKPGESCSQLTSFFHLSNESMCSHCMQGESAIHWASHTEPFLFLR